MSAIATKVNEILVDEFEIDADSILPDANLRETLDLDSLDYVDLVIAIESVSGVKLVESDFKEISNFQDLYNTIERKI